MKKSELENNFKYHAPSPEQIPIYQELRTRCGELAQYINDVVPDSREKSLAVTKLEEVVMWANAGVARNGIVKNEEK
jgi:hypothetical protein